MDNGNGRNREGIGRPQEGSSAAVFPINVTKFPRTAAPRRQKQQVLTAAQSLTRRDDKQAASKQRSDASSVFLFN